MDASLSSLSKSVRFCKVKTSGGAWLHLREDGFGTVTDSLPGQNTTVTTGICNIRKHTCPNCPYSSNIATNFKNHMRTHTREKPFACTYCSYRSTTKDHLMKHMCTHTGERPYACPYCPHRSVQKGHLKAHILTHSHTSS